MHPHVAVDRMDAGPEGRGDHRVGDGSGERAVTRHGQRLARLRLAELGADRVRLSSQLIDLLLEFGVPSVEIIGKRLHPLLPDLSACLTGRQVNNIERHAYALGNWHRPLGGG